MNIVQHKGLQLLITTLLCVFAGHTYANVDSIVYKPMRSYDFTKATPNEIVDKERAFYPFLEKLSSIRDSSFDGQVSVVHIGDSHIQADFFTGTTRKLINHYFGNPGRGLIAPNRLMRSNNGRHYKITSSNLWSHSIVVKAKPEIPIGLTGLGLQTKDATANVSVVTVDESFPGEWEFNKITAYYNLESANLDISDNVLKRDTLKKYAETVLLRDFTSQVDISFNSLTNQNISFYGFNLSNSKKGVFYHSIGINGARYSNYNNFESEFCPQISSLEPELVIISMGTNEAMGRFDEDQLYSEISDLVFCLRHSSPNAIIMLTTPPEAYTRNKRGANLQTGKVRDVIIKFAEQNGYPYWDLYNITGGKSSALQWNKKGLLSRDRIHFTQRGYEYQGELLFEAMIKSYNQFIKAKHEL